MKARSLFKGLLKMYSVFWSPPFFLLKLLFLNHCAGHPKENKYHTEKYTIEYSLNDEFIESIMIMCFCFWKQLRRFLYARRVVLSWLDRETSNNNNVSISLRPTRQGKNGWLFSWVFVYFGVRRFKYFKILHHIDSSALCVSVLYMS